jgi:hypothetical protein
MSTPSTPETLLQAKNASTSDLTPAPLTGPGSSVSFNLSKLSPPSALYVERDDSIVVQVASFLGGSDTVTFNARLLTVDGVIMPIQRQIPCLPNNAQNSVTISGAEGFLLTASALTSNATQRGQCFVRAFINRGAFTSLQPGQTLFADYITLNQGTSFPNGRILAPEESVGMVNTLGVNAPAAGSDFQIQIPTNTRVRIMSVTAQLATNATAATRTAELLIKSGVTTVLRIPASATQIASLTNTYNGSTAFNSTAQPVTDIQWLIPSNLHLAQGFSIVSATANIQAGDQWSLVNMIVEQWLMGV